MLFSCLNCFLTTIFFTEFHYMFQIIEQAKFTYSALGKALEKQAQKIEDAAKKQTKEFEDRVKSKS